MKPIETSPIPRSRPVVPEAARAAKPETPAAATSPQPRAIAQAVSAGTAPPADRDRISEIRAAVREGNYPLIPAKVADAMIAANFILIEGEKD